MILHKTRSLKALYTLRSRFIFLHILHLLRQLLECTSHFTLSLHYVANSSSFLADSALPVVLAGVLPSCPLRLCPQAFYKNIFVSSIVFPPFFQRDNKSESFNVVFNTFYKIVGFTEMIVLSITKCHPQPLS